MPDHTKDRAIDALAQRQHGAFSQRQTVSKGFTRSERRSRLGSGRWVRLRDSNVYALPSSPGTWLRQCMAGTLAVPASGLYGMTGAAVFEYPGVRRAGIEVVTRHGGTNRSPFGKVHQSHTVQRFTVVEGIRVASQADVTIQIAPAYEARELGAIVDELHRRRRQFLAELHDTALAVMACRLPGAATVREVLRKRDPGSVPPDSELNRVLQDLLLESPLPDVEFEATPRWVAPGEQRVDALIDSWKLIVEADGRSYHTRLADFDRDHERLVVAASHGYQILPFTYHQLVDQPRWCRAHLLATGAHRSQQLRVGSGPVQGAVLLG